MEHDIIQNALQNLLETMGIQGHWANKGPLDGVLELTLADNTYALNAEVKREVRMHHLAQFEAYNRQFGHYLLVAQRIFPNVKKELRKRGIAYLEGNGNIYLKTEEYFLFVDTNKPLKLEKNKGNRAFTKTGLKVLFYLLQNKEAIHQTQREIAEKANVGLGNIPQVIAGLKEIGYLIPLNHKNYVWENRKALLERWLDEYDTTLRPKLVKERYALRGNWQGIHFNVQKTVWGGEPAADILTNYLRPEKFVIYTTENRMELIKNYGLMPDRNGEVEALEMFWNTTHSKTAPPLLVYADLMLEGGKRNKETAQKIYDEHIEPNL